MTELRRIHELQVGSALVWSDRVALCEAGRSNLTWAQYQALSAEIADRLAQAGVRAGDRVLALGENCIALAATVFACSRIGAVISPINARMSRSEVDRIVKHADPAMILYTSYVSPAAEAHATQAGAEIFPTVVGTLHALTRTPESPVLDDSEVAVLLYTTGTTGDPKGVMLTHGNLLYASQVSSEMRSMGPTDLIYGALPLTHVFGLASMLCAAARSGATIELVARFSAPALFDALRVGGVTIFQGVPQMHALLMTYASEQGFDRLGSKTLKYVSSGAAPLDAGWKAKAEAFYELPLQNGWGLTECTAGACATRNPIGTPDVSVGRAFRGVELKLDESVGTEKGVGEVLTRGPHVMKGYYHNPEATAAAVDSEGWLHSGDLGRMDAEGNLYIVGRSKELIIRGGFNVYPPEVEAALNDHPKVIQSAVIGVASDMNEEIVAFVHCARIDDVTAEDILRFVGPRLAPYKRPTHVLIVTSLPSSPTGKILKHKLTTEFAARLSEMKK